MLRVLVLRGPLQDFLVLGLKPRFGTSQSRLRHMRLHSLQGQGCLPASRAPPLLYFYEMVFGVSERVVGGCWITAILASQPLQRGALVRSFLFSHASGPCTIGALGVANNLIFAAVQQLYTIPQPQLKP